MVRLPSDAKPLIKAKRQASETRFLMPDLTDSSLRGDDLMFETVYGKNKARLK